jgi:arylsulfatase A-like enzyme
MSRICKRWTPEEDEMLQEMYESGYDVNEISIAMRRYPKGIAYRLMIKQHILHYTHANGWIEDYRPEYLVTLRDNEQKHKQSLIEANRKQKEIKRKPPKPTQPSSPAKPGPKPKPLEGLTGDEQRKILRRRYLNSSKKL